MSVALLAIALAIFQRRVNHLKHQRLVLREQGAEATHEKLKAMNNLRGTPWPPLCYAL